MHILFLSGYLALASSVFADVTYNVIGFPDKGSNVYAVEIDKKRHPLKTSAETFPLWSATVVGASPLSDYRYVQLDKKQAVVAREPFARRLKDAEALATEHEFFGRERTHMTLPRLPAVYDDGGDDNNGEGAARLEKSEAFDSSQIATIHLVVDPQAWAEMMAHPMDEEQKSVHATFRFLNAKTVYSADQVKLKASGHGSRKFKKVSMHIAFDHTGEGGGAAADETFFGRPEIKLRAEYLDPTMIREKLYLDLLHAVGVPTYEGCYVRVYVNGEPQGFYLMVEDLEAPFLMRQIHQGRIKDKSALGSLYQMGSGTPAPMVYKGERTAKYNPVVYQNKLLGDNPADEPMQQFIALMRDLRDWDPAAEGGVAFWEERLDLARYLRAMVLEYLTGAWDSSWWRANNYMMYYHPEQERWMFLPTDFDYSFSSGHQKDVETTYKKFGQTRLQRKNKDHPLVTKLIYQNKDINAMFEEILWKVTKTVFNNKALDPLVHAYEKQIQDEVAWDVAIDRSSQPGLDLGWTFDDFSKSIRGPVEHVDNGILPWIAGRAKSVPRQLGKSKLK